MAPRAPVAAGEPQVATRGHRATHTGERAVGLAAARGEEPPRRRGEIGAAQIHLQPLRAHRRLRRRRLRRASILRPERDTGTERRAHRGVRRDHRARRRAHAQQHGAVLVHALQHLAQR